MTAKTAAAKGCQKATPIIAKKTAPAKNRQASAIRLCRRSPSICCPNSSAFNRFVNCFCSFAAFCCQPSICCSSSGSVGQPLVKIFSYFKRRACSASVICRSASSLCSKAISLSAASARSISARSGRPSANRSRSLAKSAASSSVSSYTVCLALLAAALINCFSFSARSASISCRSCTRRFFCSACVCKSAVSRRSSAAPLFISSANAVI